jgi:anti-anti-sigma regulatory factor
VLKIRRSEVGGRAILTLSGQIDEKDLPELQALIPLDAHHKNLTLDLEEVRLVDREAIGYLAACEAVGIELKNCPAYVRTWINARSGVSDEQ